MSFKDFPDLGKIGKRIGKRLRDILDPAIDNGPSKEERLAQRLRDSLQGLVYFDNFEEVGAWTVEDVDPAQRANTPLLPRAATRVYSQKGSTSRVLLCHDYSGGYHEWEGVRPAPVSEKLYSCNYLQFVEIFVYFSHKIVCVPPASWINACHRNGVKVLGTLMIEGDGYAKRIEKMFDEVNGEYVVARRLAGMAEAYGFDGWLFNIEAEFPWSVQHPISNLTAFIRSLKRFLGPGGTVIWYDAITKDNEVEYQNALNEKNVGFALAADAIFTNYKWTKRELHRTQAVAEQHGLQSAEVYFGIDVWAQNTNMPGPPRVTYPPKGGGGTLTGLATHELAQEGFSTAIFGPAWPYEHFKDPLKELISDGAETDASDPEKASGPLDTSDIQSIELETNLTQAVAVERAMWDGTRLPDKLSCSCKNGYPHHRPGYRNMPIKNAAHEYPTGSSSFLETNFQQAFFLMPSGDMQDYEGKRLWIPDLGSQAPLPGLLWQSDASKTTLNAELRHDGSPLLHLSLNPPIASNSEYTGADTYEADEVVKLSLFKTNFIVDAALEVAMNVKSFSLLSGTRGMIVGLYTKSILQGSRDLIISEYRIPCLEGPQPVETVFTLDEAKPNARIVDVGIFSNMGREISNPTGLLDIYSLVIRPRTEATATYSLTKLEIYRRASGENSEQRLRWTWCGQKEVWPAGLPWSDTTGPFSAFSITAEDKMLGKAHCLEFPLRSQDCVGEGKLLVKFIVQGHLFGGGSVFASLVAMHSDSEGFSVR